MARPKIKDGTIKNIKGKEYVRTSGKWKVLNHNLTEPAEEPTPSPRAEPTPSPNPEPTPSPRPEPTPSPRQEPIPSPEPEKNKLYNLNEDFLYNDLSAIADVFDAAPEQGQDEVEGGYPSESTEKLDADTIVFITDLVFTVLLRRLFKGREDVWRLTPQEVEKLRKAAEKLDIKSSLSPLAAFFLSVGLMALPRAAQSMAERKKEI